MLITPDLIKEYQDKIRAYSVELEELLLKENLTPSEEDYAEAMVETIHKYNLIAHVWNSQN